MYIRIKRILDILLAAIALVLLSWLFLIVMAAIYIDDPGNVFFKQQRVGRHKKLFMLYKFRSMKKSAPKDMPTHMFTNAQSYVTRVGRLIRKSSIDELPQLINILKGDMSFIGPRPALWNQYDLIEERDKYGANDILPGLTGWAQINGRDELPIEKKAELDGVYTKKLSFIFDCKCFFGTFVKVFKAEGVHDD